MPTPTPAVRVVHLRLTWRQAVIALTVLVSALFVLSLAAPPAAVAATKTVNQCNNIGPGPGGATTRMTCTVTVVNTINGGTQGSVTTLTPRLRPGPVRAR